MNEHGLDAKRAANWETSRFPPHRPPDGAPLEPGSHDAQAAPESVAADIVCIVGADGRVLRGEGALDPRIATGSLFEFIAPEHHDAARIALRQVFATGAPAGYHCRGRDASDTATWYECRLTPHDHEGVVVSVTFVARDIGRWLRSTDRLRHERDHIANELRTVRDREAERAVPVSDLERFRAVVDQAGEAMFVVEPSTRRIIDVNDTACRWLGMERSEICGSGTADLDLEFPLEHPETSGEHVTDTRDVLRPRMYDGVHRRRNGTSFPVEVAITRCTLGPRDYTLAVARDIKGRRRLDEAVRESEVIYRSLFELSHDAVYLTARDGTVTEVNDAAVELFGYPRDEFVGLPASHLYARPEDIRVFQRAVERDEVTRDLLVQFVAKNGRVIPGRLTATLRHAGDGNVLGYQCIIQPIAPRPHPTASPETTDRNAAPPDGVSDTVLIVEPDPTVLREAVAVLELAGIGVIGVRDVSAALDHMSFRSAGNTTVLLGVREAAIPDHAIRQLRAVDPLLRVVLLGEQVTDEDVTKRADLGVAGFVKKPIYPLALVEHLRRVMREAE